MIGNSGFKFLPRRLRPKAKRDYIIDDRPSQRSKRPSLKRLRAFCGSSAEQSCPGRKARSTALTKAPAPSRKGANMAGARLCVKGKYEAIPGTRVQPAAGWGCCDDAQLFCLQQHRGLSPGGKHVRVVIQAAGLLAPCLWLTVQRFGGWQDF